ncbi:ATP-binding protein [Pseudomonas sp. Marseille-QA0892]
MQGTLFKPRIWLGAAAAICMLFIGLWLADRFAEQRTLESRRDEARAQLQLYAQNIHILVERFRAVPALLALDGDIHRLLRLPENEGHRDFVNRRLDVLNRTGGSAVLYLLDSTGRTLAASNWNEASSFVGHDYAFRPYFQDAIAHGSGRYFAVGVTTGVPGYFLSHAVRDGEGEVIGALVLKLELEELQREWLHQDGVLLVTDAHGIVILSNRPAWRFGHLNALTDADHQRIADARKYARQTLKPIPNRQLQALEAGATFSELDTPDGAARYLWQRQVLPDEGWELHLLLEPQPLPATRSSFRLAALGLWATLAFLLLYLYQRRKNQRLQARNREELEHLVNARTAELRMAQDELVHAAKMAALGQMSAALAHEINQPLTAMQFQLGTQRLLLDAARYEDARQNLLQIDALLARMASLTTHLKTFARKSPGGLRERLSLEHVVDQALALLGPRIRHEAVDIIRSVDNQAEVWGDAIRLEQVVLNLLHNALDALQHRDLRWMRIETRRTGSDWILELEDSGGGISPENLTSVFDPFFTTKPVGEGLGLGLAVSYGIVRDLGGALEVRNGDYGALFTLRLPASSPEPIEVHA